MEKATTHAANLCCSHTEFLLISLAIIGGIETPANITPDGLYQHEVGCEALCQPGSASSSIQGRTLCYLPRAKGPRARIIRDAHGGWISPARHSPIGYGHARCPSVACVSSIIRIAVLWIAVDGLDQGDTVPRLK
jgi:hypothetical protein